MAIPIAAAIGGGLAAGGLAGSIFGKKRRPSYDTGYATNLVNSQYQQEREQIGNLRPETAKLGQTFRSETDTAQDQFNKEGRESAQNYLRELDPLTSRIVENRAKRFQEARYGTLPQELEAIREAGAASGGLDRGVAATQASQAAIGAAQDVAANRSDLENTALNQLIQGQRDVYSAENQRALTNLGIDTNVAEQIYASGNQALINELNLLLDAGRQKTDALVNLDAARQGAQIANAQNDQARQDALFQSLTGAGATLLASGLANPVARSGGTVSPTFASAVNPYNPQGAMNNLQGYTLQDSLLRRRA